MTNEEAIKTLELITEFDVILYSHSTPQYIEALSMAISALKAQPIRCKDCKWYQEGEHLSPNKFCFRLKDNDGNRIGYNFADDDFCSFAERRTDERHDIQR